VLRKTLYLCVAALLVTLATSSKAPAWYAYHYHVGGYGGYHYGGYHYGGYGGGGFHYGYYRRW
jgi:hypothetical protein